MFRRIKIALERFSAPKRTLAVVFPAAKESLRDAISGGAFNRSIASDLAYAATWVWYGSETEFASTRIRSLFSGLEHPDPTPSFNVYCCLLGLSGHDSDLVSETPVVMHDAFMRLPNQLRWRRVSDRISIRAIHSLPFRKL
jgi:hypothetical protein